jgi:hypothetical protein
MIHIIYAFYCGCLCVNILFVTADLKAEAFIPVTIVFQIDNFWKRLLTLPNEAEALGSE